MRSPSHSEENDLRAVGEGTEPIRTDRMERVGSRLAVAKAPVTDSNRNWFGSGRTHSYSLRISP